MKLSYPYRSSHPEKAWEDDIRRLISELPDDGGFRELVYKNALYMEPLMGRGDHGSCEAEKEGILVTIRFSFFCPVPDPDLSFPDSLADGKDGISEKLWSSVYRAAARSRDAELPVLSDGLLCFGLLRGSGYYWSLADHRERSRYGEHPHTFDELSDIRPSDAEDSLSDLIFTYDVGEFALTILKHIR